MEVSRQWKVIRRVKTIRHVLGALPRLFWGASTLIAGPFTSIKAARHWIDSYPELGAGLVPAPIILSRVLRDRR